MKIRKLASSVMGLAVTATLTVYALPAAAQQEVGADGTISILSIPSQSVAIRTSTCRNVPVRAVLGTGVTAGDPSPRNIIALGEMDVSSETSKIDTAHLEAAGDVTGKPAITMNGVFFWCPHIDGLGGFTLGPTQVNAQVDDGSSALYGANYLDANYGLVTIRQESATLLRIRKVRGKPALRKFRIAPRYYSIGATDWVPWKQKRVVVQKRVGGTWRTVKTIKTGARGVATFELRAKSGKVYRAVCSGNGKTWSSTSATRAAP